MGGLIDVVRSPAYATGVGLVLYGAKGEHVPLQLAPHEDRGMFRRMGSWIKEIF